MPNMQQKNEWEANNHGFQIASNFGGIHVPAPPGNLALETDSLETF
jgi:hypothetical protein